MVVVDRLINGSLYDHHTAVRRFSSGAAFSEVRVSFVPSIMPIATIIHRTTKTVVNNKLPKQWVMFKVSLNKGKF